MPELPEVETTRRGIEPHILDKRVADVTVRERRLRWPVPRGLAGKLVGQRVHGVGRRAKYLLLDVGDAHLIIHLGMSGSLRILEDTVAPDTHDHVDIVFENGHTLRYNDPRRFGSMHFTTDPVHEHWLLSELGPEPLDDDFTGELLHELSRGRKGAVKNFIMHQAIVVGVGNIYASESLFQAGIHPSRPAGRVSLERYQVLVQTIRQTLAQAIEAGGTTLRDFTRSDGSPGYFAQALSVYGREGEPCLTCGTDIRRRVIGQRSTFFCTTCQR